MTTAQYRNFVTVAECRSITGASKILMVAQPALTNQIRRIEDEVGAALFFRHPRSMELTPAGTAFYRAAKQILRLEDNMAMEITNYTNGNNGVLRLGVTRIMPDVQLSGIISRFLEAYPRVSVNLLEDNVEAIRQKMISGDIDVALVVTSDISDINFSFKPVGNAFLYLAHLKNGIWFGELDENDEVSIKALADCPVCCPPSIAVNLEHLCTELDISLRIRAKCASKASLLQIAEENDYPALLYIHQLPANSPFMFNRVLEDVLPAKRYLMTEKGKALSVVTQNFIDLFE